MNKENPNEFKIINKNERLHYRLIINQLKQQLEEKDKEIEKLKQQYTILDNENGKLTTELIMGKYKKAQKEVSFGMQLAIQELEKVKNFVDGRTYCADYINKRIQDLKGE